MEIEMKTRELRGNAAVLKKYRQFPYPLRFGVTLGVTDDRHQCPGVRVRPRLCTLSRRRRSYGWEIEYARAGDDDVCCPGGEDEEDEV